MKKKILLFSATLGIGMLALTSYDDGPAKAGLNRTGAAGSTANCSSGGCHGGATGTLTTAFILKNKTTSATVTDGKYTPDQVYVVTLACTTATSGLPNFGFQAAATKADNTNGGTLTATATNTIKRTLGGLGIIEHSSPLASVAPGVYVVDFEWKAPSKGAGTITFYGVGNAVNNNNAISGDLSGTGITAQFTEAIPASIAIVENNKVKIYPNPCSNILNIEGANVDGKMISVFITDFSGRNVLQTNTQNSFDVSGLAPGSYLVRIDNGTTQQTSVFLKK